MSDKRRGVEKTVERVYKQSLADTGRLPSGKERVAMERRVKEVAQLHDNKQDRR